MARAGMFRRAIEEMAPYTPGEQPRRGQRLIKLNTNENPYPPSRRVRDAIVREANHMLRLYPAPRADEFVASAAALYRVPREWILAGNGSDELLAMIFRAALGPGDTVAYPVPTYSLYDTLAAVQAAKVVRVPVNSDDTIALDKLARPRANLTIVCNPNSPSGIFTPLKAIAALARKLRGRLLIVDEAYVDFAPESALALLRRHPNVVVLRSLSKSFSLAGMRLGLCFARPPVIAELMKVKDSYNLSRIALAAGAAALGDEASMRRNCARIIRTRGQTIARLRRLGFEVPDSAANFVLARMRGCDLGPLAQAMRSCGILVRHFATPVLRDALRISVGSDAEMKAMFTALEKNLTRLKLKDGEKRGVQSESSAASRAGAR